MYCADLCAMLKKLADIILGALSYGHVYVLRCLK